MKTTEIYLSIVESGVVSFLVFVFLVVAVVIGDDIDGQVLGYDEPYPEIQERVIDDMQATIIDGWAMEGQK